MTKDFRAWLNRHIKYGEAREDHPQLPDIEVPGCTCAERTQQQLEQADVCPSCVSYFDLGPIHG